MARNSAAHAGRTLLLFTVGVLILYVLVALNGNWKPALGLDLQGGTRITMVAEGDPTTENLREAANIIDQRVNGTGVTEAEVTTQGNRYIVVEIPGDTSNSLVDTVKRTAQLRFRTVACSSVDPGPCGTAAPAPGQDDGAGQDGGDGKQNDKGNKNNKKNNKGKAGQDKQGNAKNRPAALTGTLADGTLADGASPSDAPSPTEEESPTEAPAGTGGTEEESGPTDKAQLGLDFMADPGQEAIEAFNAFTCPTNEPVADRSESYLVTCGTEENEGVKFLLSPAVIEGTELSSSQASPPDTNSPVWRVDLSMGGDARGVFADLSRSMVGTEQQFAIVLDGKVISNPGFTGTITDGNAQITGGFTEESAKSLATSLKYGALPIAFEQNGISEEKIGPSLAGNQLSAGITAGALGLALVMIYCLIYYRGLGLVVLASLVISAAIIYAMVLLLGATAGFTLTLPGIAGLIIGVGVTADSFVIFFERIRDEMREGRSMRVAVETGWRRAKKTRLAANVVSLLSAAVLYIFATGVVKGFGFALGLSTLIDLAILFWFTKPMVSFLARYKFFNGGGALSGLSAGTLGIDQVTPSGGKA